jgi:hypothetical protein
VTEQKQKSKRINMQSDGIDEVFGSEVCQDAAFDGGPTSTRLEHHRKIRQA